MYTINSLLSELKKNLSGLQEHYNTIHQIMCNVQSDILYAHPDAQSTTVDESVREQPPIVKSQPQYSYLYRDKLMMVVVSINFNFIPQRTKYVHCMQFVEQLKIINMSHMILSNQLDKLRSDFGADLFSHDNVASLIRSLSQRNILIQDNFLSLKTSKEVMKHRYHPY